MRRIVHLALAVALCAGAGPSVAEDTKLVTPSFVVTLTVHCAEGNVTCDDVTYVGTSRKTGKRITLRGRTKHSVCADGVTPCRFQGYEFTNGATDYWVSNEGRLLVTQGRKVLVDEQGSW